MSRLRERVPAALARGLITFLLALGMGMPLLAAAGQPFLLGRYALLCAGTAAFCSLFCLNRRLTAAALLALIVSQAALLIAGRGFFQQTLHLLRALVLLIRDVPLAMTLYGDALCCQTAVLLTLFCYTLSSPDIDVALPLTFVSGLLAGEWMLGLRRESLYMLPVLPALLLIYAYTHSYESAKAARAAHLSPWAVPLAAALLGLAWLIAPQEGATAKPLADLAERLRESINDRFFFQQERARYSLEDDGWMPLGQHRLGGRPDPDERLVMYVSADQPVYLRGAILDTYTGAYWYDRLSARRYYWDSPLYRARRNEIFEADYPLGETLPTRQINMQFAANGASTLFVPQRIRSLTVGERMTPYFNKGSEIFITRNLKSGDAYAAEYASVSATDPGIAELAEKLRSVSDPMAVSIAADYTAVPEHMQREIYDIAAAATAGCDTPWQKAAALRDTLRSRYRYSLDVSIPPRDVDFVAWFLLGEKEGYCTYFASAMTVLCRMAGLPARYVEGYLAQPGANGVAEVRGTSAHAWTEVYLNGLGWVVFDATPGRGGSDHSGNVPPASGATPTPPPPRETPTPEPSPELSPSPIPTEAPQNDPETPPTPTPTPTPTPDPQDGSPPDAKDEKTSDPWWLWLLLLLALAALTVWRIRSTEPLRRAARMKDDKALLLLWQASLRCAALLGAPIRPEETPLSYAARAGEQLQTPLTDAARAVSALRYGRRAPRRADLRAARTVYDRLRQRLKPQQRALLAVRRALTFKK